MGGFESLALGLISGIFSAQQQNAAADAQVAQINLSRQIEEQRRLEGLRREQASRGARAGGQGLLSGGGSADAVLAGLAQSSARRGQERHQADGLQIQNIRTQQAFNNRMNLLNTASTAIGGLNQLGAFNGIKSQLGPKS